MNLRFAHWFSHGFITTAALIMVGEVHGQGTIEFLNSALSRIQYRQCRISESPIVTNAPAGLRISVEVGPSRFQLTEVGSPIFTTGEGLFNGGVAYPVPGTAEGQTVWMRVVGRQVNEGSILAIGYTETLPIQLGPTIGPGTVIFQSATGTATNRFHPFTVGPSGLCFGESIIFGSVARSVVFTQPASEVYATSRFGALIGSGVTQARIDFTTFNGSAVAGVDYVPTNGTVLFTAGTGQAIPVRVEIPVRLLPNRTPAANRYFYIRLENASPTPQLPQMLIQWIADPYISSVHHNPLATLISMPTVPGWNYILESSSDLIHWAPVPGTLTGPTDGVTTIYDMRAGCCAQQFYRMRAE